MTGVWSLQNDQGVAESATMSFSVDVATCKIPLLLSRKTLNALSASMDFWLNRMALRNSGWIPTRAIVGGHLSFDWVATTPNALGSAVFPVSTNMGAENLPQMDESWFWEIHYQLAHCDIPAVIRLCSLYNVKFGEMELRSRLTKCPCRRADRVHQKPLASGHVNSDPGQVIFMDLTYPCEENAQNHRR